MKRRASEPWKQPRRLFVRFRGLAGEGVYVNADAVEKVTARDATSSVVHLASGERVSVALAADLVVIELESDESDLGTIPSREGA